MVEDAKGVKILRASLTPDFASTLEGKDALTLSDLGIAHGEIVYIDASGAKGGSQSGTSASASSSDGLVGSGPKMIDVQGNLVKAEKEVDPQGFRPGLQSLRTQKLHWTLTDMVEFDNKYTFEIRGEQQSFCASASLDAESCNSFQLYLQNFAFQTCRCAYLYGNYARSEDIEGSIEYQEKKALAELGGGGATSSGAEDPGDRKGSSVPKRYGQTKGKMSLSDLEEKLKKEGAPQQGVKVHAIYEPLQESSALGFQLLEDPREEQVEAIAEALGMEKVGIMFSHPPREGYVISTHEIIHAGEQALEATNGKFDSPFVLVKVTSDEGNASFDAFSLTPQALEMVAEDALLALKETPGHSAVNETFTVIVEKKAVEVVDNDFFIKRVPILSHSSPYSGKFPRFNRDHDTKPSPMALKSVLESLGSNPTDDAIAKALSDFQLLIFLSAVFDVDGLSDISKFVASHNTPGQDPLPLQEGYKVLLYSFAGLDH